MLSQEEELELIKAWQTKKDNNALRKLIESHKPLLRRQAKQYLSVRADMDDLVQSGAIGIIRAATNFNVEASNRFSTYAQHYTKDMISKFGRQNSNSVTIPQGNILGISKEIYAKYKEYADPETNTLLTEDAIVKRIAEELNVTTKKVLAAVAARSLSEQSMDAKYDNEEAGESFGNNFSVSDETAETEILREQSIRGISEMLEGVMTDLNPREKDIINRRCIQGQTLEEISKIYSISRERVRQIEVRAMQKMRELAENRREEAEDIFACI